MARRTSAKPDRGDVGYRIRRDLIKRVRREAVDRDCYPSEVVEEVLEEYFRRPRRTAATSPAN